MPQETRSKSNALSKCPSGIAGLDEITQGGLPRGRPTLVCGGAGSGKTLFAMQFLVRGAVDHGEPGVFMAFEETEPELITNVQSLGFDLDKLVRRKKIMLDYVRVERHEIEETGEYDLEGLFVRLEHAIDTIGAKRVVLDTLETLFSGLKNQTVVRAEFRRLFRWLKDKGMTAVITAEAGDEGQLTRQGMEEYVSDCVIFLDHRVAEHVTTRRMRVVKYRGSRHGTNEYPFLIGANGIDVLPVTSLGLSHQVTSQRVSTGLERLDLMLGGKGYYRGSSVLISGTAGTGKSSLVAHFVNAACRRGERCLYFAFEESPAQIMRNMRSIGLDLEQHQRKGLLQFQAARPTNYGLEIHLSEMYALLQGFKPAAVVVDPITNFFTVGSKIEVRGFLMRMIDMLKSRTVTGIFTSLTPGGGAIDLPEVGVSSLIDTWLLLRDVESNGERNRILRVLKSRGMNHSNQVREYLITSKGVELIDVYLGPAGVLTGSARLAQEALEQAQHVARNLDVQESRLRFEQQRKAVEAQIAALQAELHAQEQAYHRETRATEAREAAIEAGRNQMARRRYADPRDGSARGGSKR